MTLAVFGCSATEEEELDGAGSANLGDRTDNDKASLCKLLHDHIDVDRSSCAGEERIDLSSKGKSPSDGWGLACPVEFGRPKFGTVYVVPKFFPSASGEESRPGAFVTKDGAEVVRLSWEMESSNLRWTYEAFTPTGKRLDCDAAAYEPASWGTVCETAHGECTVAQARINSYCQCGSDDPGRIVR